MQINYRGFLKSCNYGCYYCPFSKNKQSQAELAADKKYLNQFVERILTLRPSQPLKILFTPYGEGLVHGYYQDAMIRLSQIDFIEAISIQTNFSLKADTFSARLHAHTVPLHKIKLWISFHPSEITLEKFLQNYQKLDTRIQVTLGAIADPKHIEVLQQLKTMLKPSDYLFVNAMEGLKIPYTPTDIAAFTDIDRFFIADPKAIIADESLCLAGTTHFFVNHTERVTACNRSRIPLGNLEHISKSFGCIPSIAPIRSRRCAAETCECFLAYSTRKDYTMTGALKTLRIPAATALKLVFFDLDGTLMDDHGKISPAKEAVLQRLHAAGIRLGIATSRPFLSLKFKLRAYPAIWQLLTGVVCSDGAEVMHFDTDQNWITSIDADQGIPTLHGLKARGISIKKTYRTPQGSIYKLIISNQIAASTLTELCQDLAIKAIKDPINIGLTQQSCSKTSGILTLAKALQHTEDAIMVVGNGESDLDMLAYFKHSVAVHDAQACAKSTAKYIWDFAQIQTVVLDSLPYTQKI